MQVKRKKRDPMAGFPQQPIVIARDKVVRFKENRIVSMVYEQARAGKQFDLNDVARLAAQGVFTKAEQMQFAQLLGYSVSGFGDLSYAHRDVVAAADKEADRIWRAALRKKWK